MRHLPQGLDEALNTATNETALRLAEHLPGAKRYSAARPAVEALSSRLAGAARCELGCQGISQSSRPLDSDWQIINTGSNSGDSYAPRSPQTLLLRQSQTVWLES